MRTTVLALICMLATQLSVSGQADFNLELIANVPTDSPANEVWGFVDQNGIEYAIVGTRDNTLVFSLESLSAPELLLTIDGSNTIWRDMKSWGNYVYSVSDETADGLTILDMSSPKDSIPFTTYFPVLEYEGVLDTIVRAHNLYVDENGILCMTGCNVLGGAPILLDVAANPLEPEVVGYVPGDYTHDIFIKDNLLYASQIYKGRFVVYDITDRMQPIQMGSAETSYLWTHNAWLSDDGTHVFTTDERNNAFVDAYDVSDFSNIRRVASVRSRKDGGSTPHNTHYHNGYLVTSYYEDGIVVIDANKPDNLVIVGRYKTISDPAFSRADCWGAYPYLPSGVVLASDGRSGLSVFQPNYPRASYAEGCVVDAVTGSPIDDVEIQIQNTDAYSVTDVTGSFRSGHYESGMQSFLFEKLGYDPLEIEVELVEGEVTEIKVEMVPARVIDMQLSVRDAESGEMVSDAQVNIFNDLGYDSNFITDDTGVFRTEVFEGEYDFVIGAWGYLHKVEQMFVEENQIVFEIQPGYQDDYYFDLGWQVPEGSNWERTENEDVETDLGSMSYENSDPMLDEGIVSPVMDLSDYVYPVISFNATLLSISADLTPTFIVNGERIGTFTIESFNGFLRRYDLPVFNYLPESMDLSEVYFEFDLDVEEEPLSGMIVVDAFLVEERGISSSTDLDEGSLVISPNPAADQLTLTSVDNMKWTALEIYDIEGRPVRSLSTDGETNQQIDVSMLDTGLYLLSIMSQEGQIYTRKFIKE